MLPLGFNAMNESERLSSNCKCRNENLTAELEKKNREMEELNSDAQELAGLVKTKETVTEDLKKSLVEANLHFSNSGGDMEFADY